MTKGKKITYASSEDSDQLGHPTSLIRVFAVPMEKGSIVDQLAKSTFRFPYAHTPFGNIVKDRWRQSMSIATHKVHSEYTYQTG